MNAEPNNAHKALAKLEEIGKLKSVITQNIDELHQRAGSKNVIELHGTANDFECHYCGCKPRTEETIEAIKAGHVPRCKRCHVVLKPKVVLYEEMLYDGVIEKAISEISRADMLVVGGTSLAVYPAASFVKYFKGRYLVMINKGETEYDRNADLIIRDSIGKVFAETMKLVVGEYDYLYVISVESGWHFSVHLTEINVKNVVGIHIFESGLLLFQNDDRIIKVSFKKLIEDKDYYNEGTWGEVIAENDKYYIKKIETYDTIFKRETDGLKCIELIKECEIKYLENMNLQGCSFVDAKLTDVDGNEKPIGDDLLFNT